MTVDHDQLKAIFADACDLEAGERAAFLDRACGDDAELRAAIDELLSADADPDADTAGIFAPFQAAEDTPKAIGRYRIVRRIGAGGMGEVFEAHQTEPVERTVALKLIRSGYDSEEVITRFDVERRALAVMDHPNTARVLDAGTTDTGRPYFVMELVDGEPITTYCDRVQVNVKARLELFLDVCAAVQHAHQKGVIHRDLKPANILVAEHDGRPVAKVIDFGVAKAVRGPLAERGVDTQLGQLLGTPEYMSPEQAALDGEVIDTRTDVYALGVILYELLVGELPFDSDRLRAGGFDECRRIIREEMPMRPGTRIVDSDLAKTRSFNDVAAHVRAVRGDLEWITMRALEKEPEMRYAGASAFAADIRRHLAHEPVSAGPPSASYRMKKLVRRHRTAVFIVLAMVVTLVGVSVASLVAASHARRAQAAEAAARQEAERSRDAMVAAAGFLGDVLGEASPEFGADASSRTVVEALSHASTIVDERFGDNPLVQTYLRRTLGMTFRDLGRLEEARRELELAVQHGREALARDDRDLLQCINSLATVYDYLRQFELARQYYLEALEIQEEVLGPDHRDTLGTAVNYGIWLYELERYDEAFEVLERTVARMRVLDEDDRYRLIGMQALANLFDSTGRSEEAEPIYRRIIELSEGRGGRYDQTHAFALVNLGASLGNLERFDEACTTMDRGLQRIMVIFPAPHWRIGHTLWRKADLLVKAGKYPAAEDTLAAAVDAFEASGDRWFERGVITEYIDLYTAWERPDELAMWQARLEALSEE